MEALGLLLENPNTLFWTLCSKQSVFNYTFFCYYQSFLSSKTYFGTETDVIDIITRPRVCSPVLHSGGGTTQPYLLASGPLIRSLASWKAYRLVLRLSLWTIKLLTNADHLNTQSFLWCNNHIHDCIDAARHFPSLAYVRRDVQLRVGENQAQGK